MTPHGPDRGDRSAIPALFRSRFTVDPAYPFRRYLNRLEVEIGREDYRHLKRVELLAESPGENRLRQMEEITGRILATTQNHYNRGLLERLGVRIFMDHREYAVYYRYGERTVKFVPSWRQQVLQGFFGELPAAETDWRPAKARLPGFEARFRPDRCGGVLLLRKQQGTGEEAPLLTATHGPYDPHTLETTFFLLRTGRGGAAFVNLGFSGREPLTDENLERLRSWGLPLNPSNVDVIFPYLDARGHPHCYKLEENLVDLWKELERPPPRLLLDIHGCVGTTPEEGRLVVGLGGSAPFPRLEQTGRVERRGRRLRIHPAPRLRAGLEILKGLSEEIVVQFCQGPGRCFQLQLQGERLVGRQLKPGREVASLLPGEVRSYLPAENVRWLPGAGGNARQRLQARRLRTELLCLHVEIPIRVRRRTVLRLRELEIGASLDSSGL